MTTQRVTKERKKKEHLADHESDFQPWDKIGASVEGYLSPPETIVSKSGDRMIRRELRQDDGSYIAILSPMNLESKLIGLEGQYVWVTFTNTKEVNNGEMKLFKVEVEDPD